MHRIYHGKPALEYTLCLYCTSISVLFKNITTRPIAVDYSN